MLVPVVIAHSVMPTMVVSSAAYKDLESKQQSAGQSPRMDCKYNFKGSSPAVAANNSDGAMIEQNHSTSFTNTAVKTEEKMDTNRCRFESVIPEVTAFASVPVGSALLPNHHHHQPSNCNTFTIDTYRTPNKHKFSTFF